MIMMLKNLLQYLICILLAILSLELQISKERATLQHTIVFTWYDIWLLRSAIRHFRMKISALTKLTAKRQNKTYWSNSWDEYEHLKNHIYCIAKFECHINDLNLPLSAICFNLITLQKTFPFHSYTIMQAYIINKWKQIFFPCISFIV